MVVLAIIGICLAGLWFVARIPKHEMEEIEAMLGPYMVLFWIVMIVVGGTLGLFVMVRNGF